MLDFEISPSEAATLVKEGKARIVDVREPWELATAKVEDSLAMPMGEVPTRAKQELKPEERLLVMCHLGVRSLQVTVWLRRNGYAQAQSVQGGIDAWSATIDPKVPRY